MESSKTHFALGRVRGNQAAGLAKQQLWPAASAQHKAQFSLPKLASKQVFSRTKWKLTYFGNNVEN